MYHSITFGEKNTWDDWRLVSPVLPSFAPPTQKTTYLDIPGASGVIDLSEMLTGYPIFNNREGSFEFLRLNGYESWQDIYSAIADYLHGRAMRCYLEDDRNWFYEGRFFIKDWKNTTPWTTVTIGYNVGPYKWSVRKTCDDWLWDPFNFQNGVITAAFFKNIRITSGGAWTRKTFPPELVGSAPVCPSFAIQGTGSAGMDIRFVNPTVHTDATRHLRDGIHQIPDFLFVGGRETLYFKGNGTVSIDFHQGRL